MELVNPTARELEVVGVVSRPPAVAEDGCPTSQTRNEPMFRERAEAILTRLLDVAVAAVALLVLLPLLIAIALAVRLTSHGPAIFRQARVGKDMRSFSLYKFRTMRPDAADAPHRRYIQALMASDDEPRNGNLYKLVVDDRITGIGRILRSWSLDEIPQLLNVLRGDMSLVGPRPVLAYEVELYPEAYLRRFSVKPGLTGLWQVSGRSERTYHEMIALDIEYAQRRSLRLDLAILIKTVPTVLTRKGVA